MLPTVLGVVFLFAGLEYSSACSCLKSHIQTQFCRSDYVMQIRLKRKPETVYNKVKTVDDTHDNETGVINRRVFSEIKYHVHINRIFKIKEKNEAGLRKNSTVAVLYTPPDDGLCGINLDVRTKYLIGGRIEGPRVTLTLCDLVIPWKLVSKRQKKNLLFLYEDNCHCQVERSYRELATADKCKWKNGNYRLMSCFERASACIADKNSLTGGCKWHRNKHLRACKAAARKPQLP